MKEKLWLHEEVMLLCLRDTEGTIEFGAWWQQAAGAAILAELLLAGSVEITDDKKHLVDLVDDQPIGEPVIDECLQKVSGAGRRASARTWVSRFANLKNLRDRVAVGLCQRGILSADEKSVMLIFSRKIYPELNPIPEQDLVERLRKAIFTDREPVDARTAVMVSLADACGILRFAFDKKQLKGRAPRIEQLSNGDMIGPAAKEAVQAVQMAIMVAVMVPVMVNAAHS